MLKPGQTQGKGEDGPEHSRAGPCRVLEVLLEAILVFLLKVLCFLSDCFHSHQEISPSLGVSSATASCLWPPRWGVCWLIAAWFMASRVPAALSEFPAQPVHGGAREGTEEKDWKSLFCFTVIWIAAIPMRKESCHKVPVSGCAVYWGRALPHGNSANYKTPCFILERDSSTCSSNQVKEKSKNRD